MKKVFFLLAVGIMISANLFAQDPGQEFTDRMNHIFQHVDKSRVTTGLLSDYGLQMVEPAYYDGVPADSNFVDMDTWKMLYSGIFTSKINNNVSLTDPETVFTQIENATHATAVPVAMMHYQYNALKENALTSNLMQIINTDQLKDITGAALPYNTKQLFAVAPKELWFSANVARFVFNPNLWYKNVNKTVQKLEINFNNQSGWLTAGWNTPVSYTFMYGGFKTIYFRITYTDATSYTSHTNVYVTDPSGSSLKFGQEDEIDERITISPTGEHKGGEIQIKYSSNNNTGQIQKPLIVAEGFDPSNVMGGENNDLNTFLSDSLLKLGIPSPVNSSNGRTLYDDIDFDGYDIVYLDYKDGVDDIWKNAELFKEVIKRVNTHKQNSGSTEQNVVMGMSMGGLVARIALRLLEIEGYNHQTKKYISVDSPHKGANMPVGFQAAVRHVQGIELLFFLSPNISFNYALGMEMAGKMVNLLNSQAAKQMLIYYMKSNYSYDHSVHNQFQLDYDNLGFPQGFSQKPIENIAISNGSGSGVLNFNPGAPIIDYQYSENFKWWMDLLSLLSGVALTTNYPQIVWNAIPGHSQIKAEFNIDALKNQTASRVYKGKVYIRKKILFLIPVNITLEDVSRDSEASMLPLDGAPGGLFDINAFADNLPFPSNAIKQSEFCFIPTGSSLALSNWTDLTQPITSTTTTPFHSVFSQSNNEPHVDFNSPAWFVCNQLYSTPIPSISGPTTVGLSANYTLNTYEYNPNTVTWSISGNTNYTLVNQTKTGVTIKRTNPTAGSNAMLTANVDGTTVTKTISPYALPLSFTVMSPQNYINSGTAGYLQLDNISGIIPGTDFDEDGYNTGCYSLEVYYWSDENGSWDWEWYDAIDLIPAQYGVYVNWPGCRSFKLEAYDCYGRSHTDYGSICGSMVPQSSSLPSYYNAYPNPASNVLNIEIDKAEYEQSRASLQALTEGKALKQDPTFDIRLYDGQGNLLRHAKAKDGNIQFNVSNLPNGIYYLHIYDGISEKPEMRQIVVEK